MTTDRPNPQRLRFLAGFLVGRPVDVAVAPAGEPAYTDGEVIYVAADADADRQRLQMLVQGALLGAGSLDSRYVKQLRARPALARRYLAVEGHRVLVEAARRLPLAQEATSDSPPRSASTSESLQIAASRTKLDAAPEWFGSIRPSKLVRAHMSSGTRATDGDAGMQFDLDPTGADSEDDEPAEKSRFLRLFEAPLGAAATASFLRSLFGSSRSAGDEGAGGELSVGSTLRTPRAGAGARPAPTPIRFTGAEKPGATVGVGGSWFPEWDVHRSGYREDWCRVVDFPVTATVEFDASFRTHDAILRRRLARVGLDPAVLRRRPDGDDVDTDALIDLSVDLHSGFSPREHVYIDRRKITRNLGVLILLDASGSAIDTDHDGLAVHDHQRRAAAPLATALDDLGDRVAVYGFRSQGRRAVQLPLVKSFGERFGAAGRARLAQLHPSGYTRLGAGIRGAGEIIKRTAGTPHRLLVVPSDGFPYDDGYEGRYAEADARRALEELRGDGVACLCLSIGASTDADSLERVFGSACHAVGATLADLSPRMDELFLTALRELSAPRPPRV
ncbi:nitric oxide reductase activation protein NorD [Mycobacterium sp. pW049]|uniref:nitric oxide reductase activation protein NorD n=1 Tax=[Mycobacterium] bulgaricum TaxID=3238985 RepID=UPI00351B22F8